MLGFPFQIALAGQVMTRMGRNAFGLPGQRPSVSNTCRIVTAIFLIGVLAECLYTVMKQEETENTNVLVALYFISIAVNLYVCVGICNTRAAIREKYKIKPGDCGAYEDCCYTCCCSCCVVSLVSFIPMQVWVDARMILLRLLLCSFGGAVVQPTRFYKWHATLMIMRILR